MKKYRKIDSLIVFENGTVWREFPKQCKLTGLGKIRNGYKVVRLKNKNVYVHRLVAELFLGKSDLTIDHIDGNKLNNAVYNLEYVTHEENLKRAWKTGLQSEATKKRMKKVLWNGKVYNSATELSLFLKLSKYACSNAIYRNCKLKGHYPEYIE